MGRSYLAAAALIALALAFATPAVGEEAVLQDITVTNAKDHLVVFFEIEGCFTQEMEEAILKGIPTTFTYLFALNRVRSWWPDKELAEFDFTRTVKFDSLKGEFTITSEGINGGKPTVTTVKDFAKAKGLMARLEEFPLVPLKKLEKGEDYQLRIKAELEKVRLPLYLHYVFFFVSLWDFETDWYTVDFKY